MMVKRMIVPVTIGLLLSLTVAKSDHPRRTNSSMGFVIENFDQGTVELFSYPGEDLQPDSWNLDSVITHNGSARALKLYGNTWKVLRIAPRLLDSSAVWSVAANVTSRGEAHGLGVMDSLHSLFFAFAGSEELNTNLWVTVDQGALSLNAWHEYMLRVADEWLSRFGYLPVITGIVFVNDRDTAPTGIVYFDDIIDITGDLPSAPQVSITYTAGGIFRNADNKRSVTVHFYSHIVDSDSVHTFTWQFGDNQTSAEQNPVHTFTVEDDHEYTVVLDVRNQSGLYGRASTHVAIDPGPSSFPLRMNFVGDIMMARGYEAVGGIIPTQGVQAIFAPTVPYLGGNADITVANLECTLTTSTTAHPTKPIIFKSSPQNVAGLVYAGIDVVTNANNHILDYGIAGLQETQNVLRQNNIRYSGAGANAYDAYLPLYYSRSGVSFAFMAMSDRTGQYNNYQPYLNASDNKPGFANLTEFELQRQISRVRNVADRVVVELHSGTEYSTSPSLDGMPEDEGYSPEMRVPTTTDRTMRRFALDCGADLVINHHSHITQGFEVYNHKLIAHSLGNFAFDLGYSETFPTVILNANVDARGFFEYNVTPVYIDHYIPRRASGGLGVHILDYLTMRSRDLGTYLIVQPESVSASIVLDTLLLYPRSSVTQRTLPLVQSGSWYVSKPERLARHGSIASIPAINPQGTWQYRLGRDVVWFGNCEKEGCNLWQLDVSDERFDSTIAHGGVRSLQHRRVSGASTLSTNFETRVTPSTVATAFSVYGWIKTDNAREATIRTRLYASRTGSEIASGDIGTLVSGSTNWQFYANDITPPSNVSFVDMFLESKAPVSGTGYAWFDDVGVIEWTDWQTYDGIGECVFPNDIYWIQVRTPSPMASADLLYREVSYVDLSQPQAVSVPIRAGWNLISNPMKRPDSLRAVRSVFPHALSDHAFRFVPGSGYVQSPTLETGIGYWGKFPSDEYCDVSGTVLWSDSIHVEAGWNLIGSISMAVDTAAIQTIPPGLRSATFFGYNSGYAPAVAIGPGNAYWMKANTAGIVILQGSLTRAVGRATPEENQHEIVVRDAKGEVRKVHYTLAANSPTYELPPPPPEGIMDVRFEENCLYAVPDSSRDKEWPIRITSAEYPLIVSWKQSPGDGAPQILIDGRAYSMQREGSVNVTNKSSQIVLAMSRARTIPADFRLNQNYPNPFNPSTTISYALPGNGRVTVQIFNITGQLVRTIVNQEQTAGWYSVVWDGRNNSGLLVGSGVYFCRMSASVQSESQRSFVQTRKLVLLH